MRSLTEVKLPRRIAWRVMIEKKISTMFSQDPDVGVKCRVILGFFASHARTSGWLGRHPRFRMHFTPTGSSWINQVERWFGYLTSQLIRRGAHKSVQALEADSRAWIKI
jgi:hypothetical protein